MKAAYIQQTGPPENIIVGDLPTPEPTGNQVLVRVKAAALNPIDTYIRSGSVPMNIPLPFIPRLRFGRRCRESGARCETIQSRRSRVGILPRPARSTRHVRRVRRC